MKDLYSKNSGQSWKQYLGSNIFTLSGNAIIAKYATDKIVIDLKNISNGISSLASEFSYTMALVIDQLEYQTEILNNILIKLDEIHNTLESPLLTQARELYRMGMDRLNRNLYEKAKESFLESEKKNDVDLYNQFQLGKLYLYGKNEDDDVVDLEEAIMHLKLACRYSNAETKYFEVKIDPRYSWEAFLEQYNGGLKPWGTIVSYGDGRYNLLKKHMGDGYYKPFIDNIEITEIRNRLKILESEANFHLATAYYIQGNENKVNDESTTTCNNALTYINKAIELSPKFLEAQFLEIKCYLAIDDIESVNELALKLVRKDIKYIDKIKRDNDLSFLINEWGQELTNSITAEVTLRAEMEKSKEEKENRD